MTNGSASMNDDPSKCSEKEVTFMEKWKVKEAVEVKKELDRLEGMRDAKLTSDLKKWKSQRVNILKQVQKNLKAEL